MHVTDTNAAAGPRRYPRRGDGEVLPKRATTGVGIFPPQASRAATRRTASRLRWECTGLSLAIEYAAPLPGYPSEEEEEEEEEEF